MSVTCRVCKKKYVRLIDPECSYCRQKRKKREAQQQPTPRVLHGCTTPHPQLEERLRLYEARAAQGVELFPRRRQLHD